MFVAAFPAMTLAQSSERVDVNVVLVDATVTDRSGNQILGLGPDDFIIEEDGVEQTIESADYFTNRRLLDGRERDAAFKVQRVREERYFILFFQKIPAPELYSELMNAKRAAESWVRKELQPADRVAVVGFDSRLKIYSDFTSDRNMLLKALDSAVQFGNGMTTPPADAAHDSILRELNGGELIADTGTIYTAIEGLADATRRIAARKVMVFFSPGMGELISNRIPIGRPDELRYDPMIAALNRANVTVNPIFLLREYNHLPIEDVLARIANETGGTYYTRVVNFASPLKRIENENNGYYLLSYRPRRAEGAGRGAHEIEARTKNPEFRVKARKSYSD